jgi:hypothetical protein
MCQYEPRRVELFLGKGRKSKEEKYEKSRTISTRSPSVHRLIVMSSGMNRRDDFTGRHMAGKPFGTGQVRTSVAAIGNKEKL